MKRRSLLLAAGAASASLAGCLDTNPEDAVINAVKKPAPADAVVVSYADLPQAEQQIARTAVEERLYHACPEFPDALDSFAKRFESTGNTYLEYHGSTYGVWIQIEDTIRASTGPLPENEPSCGLI